MRRWLLAWTMMLGGAAAAEPVANLPEMFGARLQAWSVALSPDASKIVYLGAMSGPGTTVVVADVKGGTAKIILAGSEVLRPVGCQWKTENRLICELYGVSDVTGELLGFTRILALDADGSHVKQLGQRNNSRSIGIDQYGGGILDMLPDDPNNILMQVVVAEETETGSTIHAQSPGVSAQRINVFTGARSETVEVGNRVVAGLLADGGGTVRLRMMMPIGASGYTRDQVNYLVRAKGSKDWKQVGIGKASDYDLASFPGFDETGDNLYQLKTLDGRKALFSLATDGSGRSELIFAHPIVDVDGVLRIGKYSRPVAARYTVDATGYSFFDPALLKLSTSLSKALKGVPVDILDESWDGNKKLVFAGNDNSPGRYYLYDRTTHEMGELVSQRPNLAAMTLATVTPVKYPARDGSLIPAYLTLPPGSSGKGLPTIVMPHGGPSARDELGFDWLAQFFAANGYAVLQPNFRGSTGYGKAWYAHNGFQSWPIAIGDINDGARWLAAQGIGDARRTAIFGWSYGGYAALQAAETEPGLYKAVIAVAPVTDLGALKDRARRYTDYPIVAAFVGDGPHVVAGSPAKGAARMVAPVLMFHGDHDLNVNIEQSRIMHAALTGAGKWSQLIIYPGLDHQLDDNTARTDLLRRSAAFLARNLDGATPTSAAKARP